jgi:glycine betaine/proline transport system substrate-binding protein
VTAWLRATRCRFALLCGLLLSLPTWACDIREPIVFAGLNWDSNEFHTAVAQRILRDGMGCLVDKVPGATIPLHNGMVKGDIHIAMEVWLANESKVWLDGIANGKVTSIGTNLTDAVQAWFVPKYLVEGPDAPAKGLRSVADLPRYKALFADPEEPGKGRFYNCMAGWACEPLNTKRLAGYGLSEHFTNVRPGSGAALDAAIVSALKRRKPIFFYYWGPSWLLGQHAGELLALEEPAFDAKNWAALMAAADPAKVRSATAFPAVEIVIGVNQAFIQRAPTIAQFLRNYRTSNRLVSEALAAMQTGKLSADAAARMFLLNHPEVWEKWVAPDVVKRVRASLG